jgi:copper(I)-binding protein
VLDAAAVALKGILYAASLVAGGTALAARSLRIHDGCDPPLRQRVAWFARVAAATLAAAAVGSAMVYLLRLGGGWDVSMLRVVFVSPLGAVLLAQFLAGVGLAFLGERAALAAGVCVLCALAVSGHAAARGVAPAAVVLVHVAAAAWWLGGLCVLWVGSRRLAPDAYGRLVARFSAQALRVVILLIVAGLLAAAVLLRFDPDPAQSYERTLGVKIGWVVILLALAAFNRQRIAPRIPDDARAVVHLRTSIAVEFALLAAVLSTTAILTTHVGLHDRRPPAPRVVAEKSGLSVVDPWIAATPPGAFVASGYVVLRNDDEIPDRLLSASSPRAAHIGVHDVEVVGDLVMMRELIDGLDVPARGEAALAPGVRHLMFVDIDAAFVKGDAIEATLVFERRGPLEVLFLVRRADGEAGHDGH